MQEDALTFYQILSTVRIRRLILGCYKCFVRVFVFLFFVFTLQTSPGLSKVIGACEPGLWILQDVVSF